jgi:hypothetical protein
MPKDHDHEIEVVENTQLRKLITGVLVSVMAAFILIIGSLIFETHIKVARMEQDLVFLKEHMRFVKAMTIPPKWFEDRVTGIDNRLQKHIDLHTQLIQKEE